MNIRATLSRPSVLFVTPDGFSKDRSRALALTQAVLNGGASLVQVRDRKASPEGVFEVIETLLAEGVPASNLVVNGMDPRDVVNIDNRLGVHIKEKDIEVYLHAAKEVMSPQTIIGCAVHDATIAKQAMDIHQPTYFQVGTMFATMSHPRKIPEGPTLLEEIREVVGSSPLLVGIGGIEPSNVSTVIRHGGDGVAVVTLLASAENPTKATAELLECCEEAYAARSVN